MLSDLVSEAIQSLVKTTETNIKQMALDYLFTLQKELQKLDVTSEVTSRLEKRDWFQWLPENWRTTAKNSVFGGIVSLATAVGATGGWFAKPAPVEESVPVGEKVLIEKIDKLTETMKQKYRAVGRDRKTGEIVESFEVP